MKKRVRLMLGGLFFAVMFVFAGANAYQTFQFRQSAPGWTMMKRDGRVIVEQVNQTGAATALRVGDEIISFNGRPLGSIREVNSLSREDVGYMYTLGVRRDGQTQEISLRTAPVSATTITFTTLLVAVIPAIFLTFGFAIFILKPFDNQALLAALMFGMFVPGGQYPSLDGLPGGIVAVMVIAMIVAEPFWAPLFLHFFLTFPERAAILRRFPRLEFGIYLPQILIALPLVVVGAVLLAADSDYFYDLTDRFSLIGKFIVVAGVLYILAGLLMLIVNYRSASTQSRRKLRVLVAGCLAGFVPSFVLFGLFLLSGRIEISQTVFRWLGIASLLSFILFPLSFAYAILRYQVIPVRLIIRRGVRYVFVARGSVILELVAVGVVLTFFLNTFFNYLQARSGLFIGIVSGVVSITVWNITTLLHRRVIAPVIDRRFFRRAYNAQQIFAELGQALRVTADLREMTALVSTKVQDALQTENASIFLRDDTTGDYISAASSHYVEGSRVTVTTEQGLAIPHNAFVVARLRESSQPLTIDFHDPQGWAQALLAADNSAKGTWRRESEILRQLNSTLLLPIATKEALHGFISLAPRLGDLPFSREDRQMVLAVAWQMAFAIENTQLVQRKVEEERLRREMEMATEVQRRLFPECPPELPSLDLAGVCHPARGVGGDYYDFLVLGGGQVGVAVADVAGKGISAALLMSTVQASLRSQARSGNERLTELVSSMNRLLSRSTGAHSYATFFYAQFDEQTRALTYVNAGHNPPILVRAGADSRRREVAPDHAPHRLSSGGGAAVAMSTEHLRLTVPIDSLTTGGPVIGVSEDFTYEQETVQTARGDVLVAYTDGVTEALNPRGEEFGEERLRRLAARTAHLSAAEITAKIIESVEGWCQDTPQHDDITLVIMKVK